MKYEACKKCAKTVGTVNVVGNILMILVKGYMGVAGQSKGLIADAIHSSADLLATIVMIIGIRVSDKPDDEQYPYGYGKVEYVFAIVIYLFLFVIACYILYDGAMSIVEGRQSKPCLIAAWGAIFSIGINELMFRQTVCVGAQINSPTITAKAWESRSDVYSSVAVLVGILGAKMGFHFMDPLAAIAVGVIILKICIEEVKDAILKLMDQAPEIEVQETVRSTLAKVKNVLGVKNVWAREIGPRLEFEVELYVAAEVTVLEGQAIKKDVVRAIAGAMDRKTVVKIRLCADGGRGYEA